MRIPRERRPRWRKAVVSTRGEHSSGYHVDEMWRVERRNREGARRVEVDREGRECAVGEWRGGAIRTRGRRIFHQTKLIITLTADQPTIGSLSLSWSDEKNREIKRCTAFCLYNSAYIHSVRGNIYGSEHNGRSREGTRRNLGLLFIQVNAIPFLTARSR